MIEAQLPYPPSVNTYWRHARGRTYISAKGRAYRECVAGLVQGQPIEGPVRVTIDAHPPDRRRRDIDNILKALLDALEGVAYHDDAQVSELRANKLEANPPGKVVVRVKALQ